MKKRKNFSQQKKELYYEEFKVSAKYLINNISILSLFDTNTLIENPNLIELVYNTDSNNDDIPIKDSLYLKSLLNDQNFGISRSTPKYIINKYWDIFSDNKKLQLFKKNEFSQDFLIEIFIESDNHIKTLIIKEKHLSLNTIEKLLPHLSNVEIIFLIESKSSILNNDFIKKNDLYFYKNSDILRTLIRNVKLDFNMYDKYLDTDTIILDIVENQKIPQNILEKLFKDESQNLKKELLTYQKFDIQFLKDNLQLFKNNINLLTLITSYQDLSKDIIIDLMDEIEENHLKKIIINKQKLDFNFANSICREPEKSMKFFIYEMEYTTIEQIIKDWYEISTYTKVKILLNRKEITNELIDLVVEKSFDKKEDEFIKALLSNPNVDGKYLSNRHNITSNTYNQNNLKDKFEYIYGDLPYLKNAHTDIDKVVYDLNSSNITCKSMMINKEYFTEIIEENDSKLSFSKELYKFQKKSDSFNIKNLRNFNNINSEVRGKILFDLINKKYTKKSIELYKNIKLHAKKRIILNSRTNKMNDIDIEIIF